MHINERKVIATTQNRSSTGEKAAAEDLKEQVGLQPPCQVAECLEPLLGLRCGLGSCSTSAWRPTPNLTEARAEVPGGGT